MVVVTINIWVSPLLSEEIVPPAESAVLLLPDVLVFFAVARQTRTLASPSKNTDTLKNYPFLFVVVIRSAMWLLFSLFVITMFYYDTQDISIWGI